MNVAPQANKKVPAYFWVSGDGFRKVELGSGSLVRELAGEWISGQKSGEVFAVGCLVCGEG